MNAHTWVSRARTRRHVIAHLDVWCVRVRACVRAHVCVFRSTFAWVPMFACFFFKCFCCVRVFCNFAKILLFHVCFLFAWVCVCVFSFVLVLFAFRFFGCCFTSCFYFSAGKFCCTRAMLFYCFLPQGHWFCFTLILFLFFFVNVHYLEDCTFESLQSPLNSGFARVYSGTFQGFAVRFTTFKSESSCEGGWFLFFFSLVSK